MSDKIGIINEVGDLGLGWDLLKEKEQEHGRKKRDDDALFEICTECVHSPLLVVRIL